MKGSKNQRTVDFGNSKPDPRATRESTVEIVISGPGIVTVRSTNLVKSVEARRQISALKRLKELGAVSH